MKEINRKQKDLYSIKEVSEMVGVKEWTIKYWADMYNLVTLCRNKNGEMMLTQEDVVRIETMREIEKEEREGRAKKPTDNQCRFWLTAI